MKSENYKDLKKNHFFGPNIFRQPYKVAQFAIDYPIVEESVLTSNSDC